MHTTTAYHPVRRQSLTTQMLFRLEMAASCAQQTRKDKWVAGDPDPPYAACTDSSHEPPILQLMIRYATESSASTTNRPESVFELPRPRQADHFGVKLVVISALSPIAVQAISHSLHHKCLSAALVHQTHTPLDEHPGLPRVVKVQT